MTYWQNFGLVDGADLKLVGAVCGWSVKGNTEIDKFVHFMAWLSQCTILKATTWREFGRKQICLHHITHVMMGTEYAAYILLNEYMSKSLDVDVRETETD